VRVGVADRGGRHLLELAPVRLEQRLAQGLDILGDRRLVGGVGARRAAEGEGGSTQSKDTGNRHITTRYIHGSPPREVGSPPRLRRSVLRVTRFRKRNITEPAGFSSSSRSRPERSFTSCSGPT